MRKIFFIALMALVATPLATAQTVSLDSDSVDMQQDSSTSIQAEVLLEGYDSVDIETSSSPSGISTLYSDTYLESDDNVSVSLQTSSDIDFDTYNATLGFTFTNETGNGTETTDVSKDVSVTVEQELDTVFSDAVSSDDTVLVSPSINLSVEGTTDGSVGVTVTDRDTATIEQGDTHEFEYGDTILAVHAESVAAWDDSAKLTLMSNTGFSPSFADSDSSSSDSGEEEQGEICTLGLRSIGDIGRGQSFSGRIICDTNGYRVGPAEVIIKNPDSGKVIDHIDRTSGTGYFQTTIPEIQPDKVLFRVIPVESTDFSYYSDTGITRFKENTKELSFGQSYDTYIANKPAFHLQIVGLADSIMTQDSVSGVVENKNGENVTGATVEVTKPDGTVEVMDTGTDGSGFALSNISSAGQLQAQATKDGYQDSETYTVNVSDPSRPIEVEVEQSNPDEPRIEPGERIKIEFRDRETGELIDELQDVSFSINGQSDTYTVSGGTFPEGADSIGSDYWAMKNTSTGNAFPVGTQINVQVPEQGRYASETQTITVQQPDNPGVVAQMTGAIPGGTNMILGVLLVIVLGFLGYINRDKFTSGSRNTASGGGIPSKGRDDNSKSRGNVGGITPQAQEDMPDSGAAGNGVDLQETRDKSEME